jgi:hypothetical protein
LVALLRPAAASAFGFWRIVFAGLVE